MVTAASEERVQRPPPLQHVCVSSRRNPAVQAIRRLARRRCREEAGLFWVEGIRLAAAALEQGADVQTLILAPALLTSALGWEVVEEARARGVPALQVTPEVFESLSSGECGRGIGLVIRQRWTPLPMAEADAGLCWVALHAVQYPGNLGAILRICDAVGAEGVILLGNTTDPYDAEAVRASLGAVFGQKLVRTDLAGFAEWAQRNRCQVVGATPSAAMDYRAGVFRRPVVLMLGSERYGLLPEHEAVCGLRVRIPMVGRCDSLNLAVAAGLLLYTLYDRLGSRSADEGESGYNEIPGPPR